MFNSFYGLSFNPFDKQQLKETDHFISKDFTEMTSRLGLSQGYPWHRRVYVTPRDGKILLPQMFCQKPEPKPFPHGIPVSVYNQCCRLLQTALCHT